MDILEQLEQKILNTVSALDDARKESMTFRDECSSLREETDKLKEGNNKICIKRQILASQHT